MERWQVCVCISLIAGTYSYCKEEEPRAFDARESSYTDLAKNG